MQNRGRALTGIVFALLAVPVLCAAKEDPVQWTLTPAANAPIAPGDKVYLELKATIQSGWHLYSPTTPPGGPIITTIGLTANPAIASYQVYRPQPVRKLDPNFQLDTETYSGAARFIIEAVTAGSASGAAQLEAKVRYQSCTDVKCLPPVSKTVQTTVRISKGAPPVGFNLPGGYAPVPAEGASTPL